MSDDRGRSSWGWTWLVMVGLSAAGRLFTGGGEPARPNPPARRPPPRPPAMSSAAAPRRLQPPDWPAGAGAVPDGLVVLQRRPARRPIGPGDGPERVGAPPPPAERPPRIP